jgi:lysine 2,3-aminomutase
MTAVAKTLRTLAELRKHQLVDANASDDLEQVAAHYAVAITPAMTEIIHPADPDDPIRRQFVPDAAELR